MSHIFAYYDLKRIARCQPARASESAPAFRRSYSHFVSISRCTTCRGGQHESAVRSILNLTVIPTVEKMGKVPLSTKAKFILIRNASGDIISALELNLCPILFCSASSTCSLYFLNLFHPQDAVFSWSHNCVRSWGAKCLGAQCSFGSRKTCSISNFFPLCSSLAEKTTAN